MNKLASFAIAALGIALPLTAQRYLEIYPGFTSGASRGNLDAGAGELLQGFHRSNNRGIGDQACNCAVDGARFVLQDQNASTVENYFVVFRQGNDVAGPGNTVADYLGGGPLGPVASPLGTAVPSAWLVTVNFTTPIPIPCEDFFVGGLELPPNALFPADGLLMQVASGAGSGDVHQQHASAADIAWQMIPANGVVSHPPIKLTWRFALGFATAPVFQAGNITPGGTRFGNGGYFPNTALTGASSQGISIRCFHPLGASGTLIGFVQIAGLGPQVGVLGFNNCLYLSTVVSPIAFPAGTTDGTRFTVITAGINALPAGTGLTIGLQGLVTPSFEFTNAVGVTLN
ncbi:MAG: hypothetical protein AB7I19_09535 [Planctomycetota bacterium]